MSAHHDFITELESAVGDSSASRRGEVLRRITDLFIGGSGRLSDQQIAFFDDVITNLAAEIELSARVLLAARLAPLANAPPRAIRALAFDNAEEVAAPVLRQSERLSETDLIENARMKGQGHMLAISRRKTVSEAVTDVLVERGDRQVLISTVENRGARFSDCGFAVMVRRAELDEELTVCLGQRSEMPIHLFRQLLERASQSVRTKLEKLHPDALPAIVEVVAEVANRIEMDVIAAASIEEVASSVDRDECSKPIDGTQLQKQAELGNFSAVVSALSRLSALPVKFVEQILLQRRPEKLLLLARSLGLSWSAVRAILNLRADKSFTADGEISECLASYERLRPETAQGIIRFYREHEKDVVPAETRAQ